MVQGVNDFLSDNSELVNELKRQLEEKNRILDGYKKEHGQLGMFFDSLIANVQAIKPLAVKYVPKDQHSDTEVIAVMQITDGHMGAVQRPDEIEGFNEFNPEICRARQLDFAHRFNRWTDRNRLSYTINECAVLVTGDLISGDIHDELKITNAFPITVQVVEAAKVLAEQMIELSQNFTKITVHFIAADNHGRLTKKPQAKDEGLNSMNYLVGTLAKAYLSQLSSVEFNIYPMHEKVIHVGQRNYLIAHGHGMRAWMGIPWYDAERKVGKESTARMQLIMDQKLKMYEIGFHKFIFGHFHTPINTIMYSCGGSVQGTDAYDHRSGRYAPPSQPAWLVHPVYKEVAPETFEL